MRVILKRVIENYQELLSKIHNIPFIEECYEGMNSIKITKEAIEMSGDNKQKIFIDVKKTKSPIMTIEIGAESPEYNRRELFNES